MKVPEKDTVVRFEIAPRTIGLILLTLAGVWLLRELWVIGVLVVVSLVFAGTFNPLVEWLERRGLKRTWSLLLLFVVSLAGAVLVLALTVPPLVEQLTAIVHGAPASQARLVEFLAARPSTAPFASMVQDLGLDELLVRLETYLLGYSSQAAKGLGYFATAIVLSFYFLADGKRTQGVLYALVPRDYHMRLARILHKLETIVGGYMRGQLLTSAAIGIFTLVLLLLCGVPNALSLALLAALADVIPFVGGIIVGVPAVLSALPRGLPIAGIVMVALFIYMEFENRILVPRIYGRALRLSPASVVLALLAGGLLLGAVGALLALPIAAGLQMILEELRVELPGDDSEDKPARAREAKIEATYEQMSAGATAPEAGQIASTLEHSVRDAAAAAAVTAAALAAAALAQTAKAK